MPRILVDAKTALAITDLFGLAHGPAASGDGAMDARERNASPNRHGGPRCLVLNEIALVLVARATRGRRKRREKAWRHKMSQQTLGRLNHESTVAPG